MSATQRARSAVPLDTRSLISTVPGVPWWGALAIAAGSTAVGILIDAARGNELTSAFTAFYVLGCIAAVVAVRHRGLFTAMAQPPLLLMVAVPLGQEIISTGSSSGLKDLLLNVAYPLVNRFPAMLLATVVALLIGGFRIYAAQQSAGGARSRAPRQRARSASRTRAAGRRTADRDSEPRRTRSTPRANPRSAKPSAAAGAAPVRKAPPPTASVRDVTDTRSEPAPRRRPAPVSDGARAVDPAPHVARTPRRPRPPRTDFVPPVDERAPRRRPPAPEAVRREPRPAVAPHPAPTYEPPQVRYRDRYED
ncbi:DUF6542 domain-containing protein [Rhodococcus sp. (in: high G+C Gram-positive bacteria)]|uniref:DUF6542 domain-containing protein n=1 Tax=Rhodococcus sp. TaxID=1831 RepID=UPI00388E2685